MENRKPIIFLAFANEKQDESRYLRALAIEQKQLERSLEKAEQAGLCELIVKTNCELRDIWETFQRYQDRIAIFHYGGHADGYQLLLETADGDNQIARGEGLVSFLGSQLGLKLVFLNGCSTEAQAIDLTTAGVPAVIGTSNSINDSVATQLANSFYRALGAGLTLERAWKEAQDEIRTRPDGKEGLEDNKRGLRKKGGDAIDRFPWNLKFREGSQEVLNNWNLPDASDNPLFGLPDIPRTHNLPESPFLFLKRYERRHAEVFFGRSYYVRELFQKVVDPGGPPIILLYGQSGVGKSSLFDAGLVPRLEGVIGENGESEYEVRYLRRVRDLALGGTLAQGLSYTLEKQEGKATDEAPEDLSVNEEKLKQIEAIVEDLQGETREDFSEFLDHYRSIQTYRSAEGVMARKDREQPEVYAEGSLLPQAGEALREAWRAIEAQSGKKLIVILDQVEELFTQPHKQIKDEMGDCIALLQGVFALPGRAPKGKIIFGYRKEYNPEIEERFKVSELPRTRMFLEKLRHKDLLEIFKGLTTTPRLKARYNLTVEESLPGSIADDLLKDKENPVAPVLQILLTKLWNKATSVKDKPPYFSREMYNHLQREGLAMKEFFQQQMALLEAWNPEVVSSGLALDVLEKHTTGVGTSQARHISELRQLYRHRPDVIDTLVQKFKEYYLLTEAHGETSQGEGYTALPHDTLAPIVMEEYNHSDKLGQRSFRILVTKTRDVAVQNEQEVRLDDMDLGVVEEGRKGMRDLNQRERSLLEISVEERKKRLKLKQRIFQITVITAFIFLILGGASTALTVSAMKQKQKDRVLTAFHESQKHAAEGRDSLALTLAGFAFQKSASKPLDLVEHYFGMGHQAIRKRNEQRITRDASSGPDVQGVRSTLVRPFSLSLRLPEPRNRIKSMEYDPGHGVLVGTSSGRVNLWSPQGGLLSQTKANPDEEVYFSADGKYVQTISGKHSSPMFLLKDQLVANPPAVKIFRKKAPDLKQEVGVRRSYDLSKNMISEEILADNITYIFDAQYLETQNNAGMLYHYFANPGGVIVEINQNEGKEYQLATNELYVSDPSFGNGELFYVNFRDRKLEPAEEWSTLEPMSFSKGEARSFEAKIEELGKIAGFFQAKVAAYDSYFSEKGGNTQEYIGEYNMFSGQLLDVRGNAFSDLNDFLIAWDYLEEGYDATENIGWLHNLGLLSEGGDTLNLNLLFAIQMVWDDELQSQMYNGVKNQTEPYFSSEIKKLSRYLNVNYPTDSLKVNVPCRKTENVRMDSVVLSLRNFQGQVQQRFTHPEAVYFIRALTDSTYATLSIDSGQVKIWQATRKDTTARWQSGYRRLIATLKHETPVKEVRFIADHSYIFSQSSNEIQLHFLDGKPHARIPHKGMKSYQFSLDNKDMLTCSDSLIKLYQDQTGQIKTYSLPSGHKLQSAHFTADKSKFTSVQTARIFSEEGPVTNWVYLWQIAESVPQDSFEIKAGWIEDATVVETSLGRRAVAITYPPAGADKLKQLSKRATFWTHDKELKDQQFPSRGKDDLSPEEAEEIKNVFLVFSPDRKQLVYMRDEEEIRLKDLGDARETEYSMSDGYSLGFGSMFYTPDYTYLIASKANSLFFWDPFPDRDKQWQAEVASLELDLATKEAHNLDSLMDHVPGGTRNEKYLSLLLLGVSLLYIFYAVAKRLFHLVQIKDYLEIGLTLGVYFLFGLIILFFWSEREMQVLTSLLPMIAISILVMRLPVEIRTGPKLQAYTQSVLGVLLVAGLVGLWHNEGMFSGAGDLVFENYLWTPLAVILIVAGMIAFPVGMALRKRKKGSMKGFYAWLLWPVATLSIALWSILGEEPADYSLMVFGVASLMGLGVLYRQGKIYVQNKKWLALGAYLLLAFTLILIDAESENLNSLVVLVWLGSLIQGGMAYRRQHWGYAFWTTSSGIALFLGHLGGTDTLLGGDTGFGLSDLFVFALVAGVLLFGMRFAVNRYYTQSKSTGRMTSLAMGVAVIVLAGVFVFSPDQNDDYDPGYYGEEAGLTDSLRIVDLLQADPEGARLFVAGPSNEVQVFDLAADSLIRGFWLAGEVLNLGFSPGGDQLLTASADGYGTAWDPVSLEPTFEMSHSDWVRAIAQSPDRRYFLTGSDDRLVHLWNVYTGEESMAFAHEDWVQDVAFSPDGKSVLSASDDSTARLWALNGEVLQILRHSGPLSQAGFFPDGQKIFTVSDSLLTIWSPEGQLIRKLGFGDWITAVALNPDGESFWVAHGYTLDQVDLQGNVKQSLQHEIFGPSPEGITAMCLVPAKGYVVTAYAGEVLVWYDTGELAKSIPVEFGYMYE